MESKPDIEWDELHASTDFKELGRYLKGSRVDVYSLRPVAERRAEVWVVENVPDRPPTPRLEATFSALDELAAFLDQRDRQMTKDGWRKL